MPVTGIRASVLKAGGPRPRRLQTWCPARAAAWAPDASPGRVLPWRRGQRSALSHEDPEPSMGSTPVASPRPRLFHRGGSNLVTYMLRDTDARPTALCGSAGGQGAWSVLRRRRPDPLQPSRAQPEWPLKRLSPRLSPSLRLCPRPSPVVRPAPASPGTASCAPAAGPRGRTSLAASAFAGPTRGVRARCPRSRQSLALRRGRAPAGPGSQPWDGRLWEEACLRGGGAGLRSPCRSAGGPPSTLAGSGAGFWFRWGQPSSFVTPHDSDKAAGSSFLVAIEQDQLFHAIVKMPNSKSCCQDGMF